MSLLNRFCFFCFLLGDKDDVVDIMCWLCGLVSIDSLLFTPTSRDKLATLARLLRHRASSMLVLEATEDFRPSELGPLALPLAIHG